VLLALCCGLAGTAPAALAQSARPPDADAARKQLQDAERARADAATAQRAAAARAQAAAAEEQRLSAARTTAAARLREAESATLAVARRMDDLARTRQQADARLKAEAAGLAPLLPVVERLSLYPAETLLAAPGSAEDAVRGLIVLQGLSRRIEADAASLRQTQAEADAATRDLRAEVPKLAAAEAAQAAQGQALDQQIAATEAGRQQAVDESSAAARQGAEAATRAENLRSAITTLEAEHRAAEQRARADELRAERRHQTAAADAARRQQEALAKPAETASLPSGAAPRGQLTLPVAGTVLRGWGAPGDGGPATGVTYQPPPAARVVAMCGGRVEFSAPFRSYGLLLIVDCGGGYHAVMAGFQKLDAKVGQLVRAGEPVGAMPSWTPGQAGARPTLYVELRRGDQPIDPTPWLKANG
jgi:septal ring factor EnvC (AmiA/AmiB activator)